MTRLNRRRVNELERRQRKTVARTKERPIAEAVFQPWFQNIETSKAILRLIPPRYLLRMRWAFEDFGCFSCRRKNVLYAGNGFCIRCRMRIYKQLILSATKRSKKIKDPSPPEAKKWYFDRADAAEKLLADLAGKRAM